MSNIFNRSVVRILCLSALCKLAPGQGAVQPVDPALHLIAVVPTNNHPQVNYDPRVYRLGQGDGGLKVVYTLSLGNQGLNFTRADFSSRRVVFGWPRDAPEKLCIVNMDAAASVAILPLDFSDVPPSAWRPLPAALMSGLPEIVKPSALVIYGRDRTLVERPGRDGHWLALDVTTFRGVLTAGYRLDSKPRREVLDLADFSRLRVQGDFGLDNELGESDAQFAHVQGGRVFAGAVDIGVPAPEGANDSRTQWRLVAHDGNITVMYRHAERTNSRPRGPFLESHPPSRGDVRPYNAKAPDDSNCASRLYIRGGWSGEWKTLQVPGLEPRVKMIDSWVTGAAVCEGFGRESPGAPERRRYQERYREEAAKNHRRQERLPTDDVFLGHNVYLPGVLFLIDVATGHYFEIRTGQGDSEILLVHNETVYYRVNDSLYSAALKGDAVGPGVLLVSDDAIPDVHWAFWGS